MLDAFATITVSDAKASSIGSVAFPLRLRRARPGDVAQLGLEYVDAQGRTVPGQWFADRADTARLLEKFQRLGQKAILVEPGDGLQVVLQPGGADVRLPVLQQMLGQSGAEIVSHRPGRRAVIRYADGHGVRYAKVIRSSRIERILAAHRLVEGMENRAFAIATIEQADVEAGVVRMHPIEGDNLHDLAKSDHEGYIRGCRVAGQALRSLHGSVDGGLPIHGASQEVAMLQERVRSAEVFVPRLGRVIGHMAKAVCAALENATTDATRIHRDFYDKQVVIGSEGQPGLLDFDTLACGESALDIANMLGHLELRVLQGLCSEAIAKRAARAFLDGYEPTEAVRTRIGAYLDATRLRLAILYAFWPKWASISPLMLGLIGARALCETGSAVCAVAFSAVQTCTDDAGKLASCPLVFVVGCPRSGTTMLERMLDAHPDVAMAHETHWITKHDKPRRDLTRDGCLRADTLDQLYADHRFVRMAPPREQVEAWMADGPLTYRAFVARVYEAYGIGRGKAVVGDKSTGGYLRNLDRLRTVCPDSRIVHLIRDGRDVCLSMRRWPKAKRAAGRFGLWDIDPVATTAAWWQWHVRAGLEHGRKLGAGVYHEVRFEALVSEPAAECASLCEYLEIPSDASMAEFYLGRSEPESGGSANAAWLPPTPGLRDWRTQMAESDVEMFEAIAGETLSDLGYDRYFLQISPAVAALAADHVAGWNQEIGGRQVRRSRVKVGALRCQKMKQGEIV